MAWATPKTNWSSNDAIAVADLNRIEENIRISWILGHGVSAESIASAGSLDITTTTNIFYITGNTNITYIKTTGRAAGSVIYLTFADELSVWNDGASPGSGYAKILMQSTVTTATDFTLSLVYDGVQWRRT